MGGHNRSRTDYLRIGIDWLRLWLFALSIWEIRRHTRSFGSYAFIDNNIDAETIFPAGGRRCRRLRLLHNFRLLRLLQVLCFGQRIRRGHTRRWRRYDLIWLA